MKVDPSKGWTLIPPHCSTELEPDLEDAESLLREGDAESARDAALYLLEECQDMLAAHELLARIAEGDAQDLSVAQGHYGYVFELTLKWLGPHAMSSMDKSRKVNRIALACAEGLHRVLSKKGQVQKAAQVASHIAAWKGMPTDRPADRPPGFRPPGSNPRPTRQSPPKRRPMMPKPDRRRPEGQSEQEGQG